MADDVGEEAFGTYARSDFETPHINAMAQAGLQFSQAFSQPLCTPSRVEIMTGRSNIRNYVAFGLLDPQETTFGHVFQEAGYATGIFGKWQLYGPQHYSEEKRGAGTLPDEAGFDEWALWQVHTRPSRYWEPTFNVNGERRSYSEDHFGPKVLNDFLLDFIEAHREEPFFAYYPMNLPHYPFVPTPNSERRDQSELENFKDMVAYIDEMVGRVKAKVEALGIEKRTLIIFTSDNGSHRSLVYEVNGEPYRGGKAKPIEAGMHVPLVAWMPGTVPGGEVSDDLIGFSDVLPTLADFAGVPRPEVELDGVSFAPQLRGEEGAPRTWLFSYYWPMPIRNPGKWPEVRFVWDRAWKLYSDGRLYHIAEDPREERPIRRGEGNREAQAAREKLRKALESMPTSPMRLMTQTSADK